MSPCRRSCAFLDVTRTCPRVSFSVVSFFFLMPADSMRGPPSFFNPVKFIFIIPTHFSPFPRLSYFLRFLLLGCWHSYSSSFLGFSRVHVVSHAACPWETPSILSSQQWLELCLHPFRWAPQPHAVSATQCSHPYFCLFLLYVFLFRIGNISSYFVYNLFHVYIKFLVHLLPHFCFCWDALNPPWQSLAGQPQTRRRCPPACTALLPRGPICLPPPLACCQRLCLPDVLLGTLAPAVWVLQRRQAPTVPGREVNGRRGTEFQASCSLSRPPAVHTALRWLLTIVSRLEGLLFLQG